MYGLKPVLFRGSRYPSVEGEIIVQDPVFEGAAFSPYIITAKECGFSEGPSAEDELNCFE
jgi:hypothetical protein